MRQPLRSQLDLLIDSMGEHPPRAPPRDAAGWTQSLVPVVSGIDLAALAGAREDENVFIDDGTDWCPAEPTGPLILRNYSGPNAGAFVDGARVIG